MSKEKITVNIDADLEELIPHYLSNRANDITAIKEAIETGDIDKVRILGHSMKGSGGGYGFDMISTVGREIEEAAKKGETAYVLKHLDTLSDYLDRVNVVYM